MGSLGERIGVVFGGFALALVPVALGRGDPNASVEQDAPAADEARVSSCVECHDGIEPMHPEALLSCVDCHGGDAGARKKADAHVRSLATEAPDERVAAKDENLAYRRFINPMDLRVVETTCGECHADVVSHLETSLHGTTAGHLSDGYYEMGLVDKKESRYGVFPVPSHAAEGGELKELDQVPAFRNRGPRDELSTHYADLARKECMQCHLWSEGRAVRGRVGFDGDYRGEGCAACHVEYALDGLSESRDRSIPRNEPGHPRTHSMTRAPTTQTCTTCHYGDASIGLHFRGLSQLPPEAPGGPDIPGTTDELLNRTFYLDDPAMVPPDLHHAAGMHCIDCHTANDVMGDGALHGAMEHAVEISCSDCHGTFTEPATLRTARGTRLEHLRRAGDKVVLTSKVDGREHTVTQVVHVLDPERPEYNAAAAEAMTGAHADVECYTCHAGWNVNFLGFHFDRNESLTQRDLLSGRLTPGRVTTQEKVFSTWKSFYAGLNESGRVAPYLTGFSTMGTVRDRDGEVIIDQQLPVTAAGLSGLTMIHHQLHSTRPTARSCVECHRSSATWGLGSVNFRLARQLAFIADRRGIEVVAMNRAQLSASTPLVKFVLPDVVDIELDCDPLQGQAQRLFASEGHRGIHVLDVTKPTEPRRTAFVTAINPRGLALAGDHLYCADGVGGLRIFDVSGDVPELVSNVPMFDAHDVFVQWPYAYVADGPGGLVIVDVRNPERPTVAGGAKLSHAENVDDAAIGVEVLFQYSRPLAKDDVPLDRRTAARVLVALVDENEGLCLIDATEPTATHLMWPRQARGSSSRSRARDNITFRGLALASHVDLAEPQGGTRTREGDFVYLLGEARLRNGESRSSLAVWDVTQPAHAERVGRIPAGYSTEMVALASFYNPPFLQTILFTPGELGVFAGDATVSGEPRQLGAMSALREAYVVAVEEFPLDKMLDEAGRPLKDVSHADSRWLELHEVEKLMLVPGEILGTLGEEPDRAVDAARMRGQTARLMFAHLDADLSGLLEGDELEDLPEDLDRNGDGHLTLSEYVRIANSDETVVLEERLDSSVFLTTRVDEDGDLSRLLDGQNPFEFDTDGDRRLDRKEMLRAFFAALDLDDDGRLSMAELSRHPGELRQLRLGGESAKRLFGRVDDNGDGRVSLRELELRDEDWRALDENLDGYVHLGALPNPWWEERGFVGAQSEWPTRQPYFTSLSPIATAESLLAALDTDGDGNLSQRELKRRPEILIEMDNDGDSKVDADEYTIYLERVARRGVDVTADDFKSRWDTDGNGKVEGDELPPGVDLATRRE